MAVASSRIYQKLKRALAAYGIVVRASNTSDLATDPTISSGTGAPSEAEPDGSVYLRKNGASGTSLYQRVSGAWVASGAITLADPVLAALVTYGLDRVLTPTVTAAGGSGGATAGTLSLQLKRLDGSTNPAAARQVLIIATPSQYAPNGQPVSTVTFGSATTGSIIASGNGWALVETDAAGAFVCVPSDSADETIYFRCCTADAVSDASKACQIIGSNGDDATWAA